MATYLVLDPMRFRHYKTSKEAWRKKNDILRNRPDSGVTVWKFENLAGMQYVNESDKQPTQLTRDELGEELIKQLDMYSSSIEIVPANVETRKPSFKVELSDGVYGGRGSGLYLGEAISMALHQIEQQKKQLEPVTVSIDTPVKTLTPPKKKKSIGGLSLKK